MARKESRATARSTRSNPRRDTRVVTPSEWVIEWETEFDWRAARRRLVAWYRRERRILPWRENPDPYWVWVSEIMLQQTQVATVLGYFERFVKQFPTVTALAEASEQVVLRAWEGLGYYRRARQLQAAARWLVAEHNGLVPHNFSEILRMPGVGRYTAGAIASIAWNQPQPIVEGNTLRLYSRLLDLNLDVSLTSTQTHFWEFATRAVAAGQPREVNQALMELGNQVCRVREPLCAECPLQFCCRANHRGTTATVPWSSRKMLYTELTEAALLFNREGRWLVRQCGPEERWAGLWDFPRYGWDPKSGTLELISAMARDFGVQVSLTPTQFKWKHAVTRYRIQLSCFRGMKVRGRWRLPEGARWVSPAELQALPLSITGRRLADFALAEPNVEP